MKYMAGIDYADQRYYASSYGRFTSVDPDSGSANPKKPGSWNRYVYASNDPVNRNDPTGKVDCESWTSTVNNELDGVPDASTLGNCAYGGGGNTSMEFDPCSIDPSVLGFLDPSLSCQAAAPPPMPPTASAPPPPSCSISLYERGAGSVGAPWKHTYLYLTDPNLNGGNPFILQAGPSNGHWFGGNLTSEQVNSPATTAGFGSNMNNGSLPGAKGNKEIGSPDTDASACADISDFLSAISDYNASKQVSYLPIPIPGTGTYNSNSFTYTLLNDVSVSFGSPGFAPGWNMIVPNLN